MMKNLSLDHNDHLVETTNRARFTDLNVVFGNSVLVSDHYMKCMIIHLRFIGQCPGFYFMPSSNELKDTIFRESSFPSNNRKRE